MRERKQEGKAEQDITPEKIIEYFHALKDDDDRMDVVAELYFSMYRRSISEVMGTRVIIGLQRELAEKEARCEELMQENASLKADIQELDKMLRKKNYPDNPSMIAAFFNGLTNEEQASIRKEVKEEIFYRKLKLELATRKERIELLEREVDNYIMTVRELKKRLGDQP